MKLINKIIEYMEELLGISVTIDINKKVKNIPIVISSQYQICRIQIYNHQFLLAIHKDGVNINPSVYKKHVDLINKITGKNVIIVLDKCTASFRKHFIQYKLPFIVPSNQMYLPDLLIDLREYYSNIRQEKRRLSPSTQVFVLYHLLKTLKQPFTAGELKEVFKYSKMTLTRVIDELENHNLCRSEQKGRKKFVWFNLEGQKLWEKTLPILRTPVKKKMYLTEFPKNTDIIYSKAGFSALSDMSMIAQDKVPVFAISQNEEKMLRVQKQLYRADYQDEASLQLEIWSYDPVILAKENIVDCFSLILSMYNIKDERIQSALKEVERRFPWK